METTAYAITRDLDAPFDEVVERVTAALGAEGFGVLTTIDVAATLRAKLGLEVPPYLILGACNPQLASRGGGGAPAHRGRVPGHVVVRSEGDVTRVAAMEPLAAMALAANEELEPLAREARERVERAVAGL
jgi:uncharacterized protein (DUF302 family)